MVEENQHGSRARRGTLSQLLNQHDYILEKISLGHNVDSVFLDFAKAFDLVDHSLLITKMRNKGIKGKLLTWLINFLKFRDQQVRIGNTLSDPFRLVSGVPQGSVMGPLMFLVFIGDLGINMEDAMHKVLKYVDDSKFMGVVNNLEEVAAFQEKLNQIYNWANENNMRWNDMKFGLMRFGKDQNIKDDSILFTPGFENVIDSKDIIKDLGIKIDP